MTHLFYDVECPQCQGKAMAIMAEIGYKSSYREKQVKFGATRIICSDCLLAKNIPPHQADCYVLWYKIPFKQHTLWANNKQHLQFIIDYLSGNLSPEQITLASQTMIESLPKWLIVAKNRAKIVKSLNTLINKSA